MLEVSKHLKTFLNNRGDERVAQLWLMDDISTTIWASVLYIFIVKYIVPSYMENRKPYSLKTVLLIYNAFQVLLNAYIFYEIFNIEWLTTKKMWNCQTVDYSTNAPSMRILRGFYLYFLSKFTEYLDTFFFALRKKNNQISFLHIYHHSSMPIYMWLLVKFYGGGSMIIIPLLNSFVHIVMYSYYLLAGLGPEVQKYIWWKKYITNLQLIQFLTGLTHMAFMVLDSNPNCNIPKTIIIIQMCLGIFFYILFSNFYKQAYGTTISKKKICFITYENCGAAFCMDNIKSKVL